MSKFNVVKNKGVYRHHNYPNSRINYNSRNNLRQKGQSL